MQTLQEKIAFLYPERAEEVSTKLLQLLDEYKKKIAAPKKRSLSLFSEKDTILIVYADHVQEPQVKTLQTMNKFLTEFATGSFNKIHVLPFYPYSSDDGFSVIDYYKVHENFGDWNDLQSIHNHFFLMYDFVLNHISKSSALFKSFLSGNPDAEKYFVWFDELINTSLVYRPRTNPLLTPFKTKTGTKYVWTTFSSDQIDLSFNAPEVLLEAINVLLFYITHGAETIRLDAVGYLWKDPNTSSAHLPQTHMIVKIFRQILEEVAPWVWIIPEANAPLDINLSYFDNASDEAHLVYNFTLPPLLLYSFITGNASELTKWAKSLVYPSGKSTFLNITATHDGIGLQPIKKLLGPKAIKTVVDYVSKHGGKINYRTVDRGQEPYELNAVYRSAVGGTKKFFASQAIQLALKGVPAVYLNSYIGEENWNEGVKTLEYNRAINRRKFNYQKLLNELHDPHSIKYAIYTRYKHLLTIRRKEPLFNPLVAQEILDLDPRIFAIKRFNGTDILLAVTNVADKPVSLSGLTGILNKSSVRDLLSNEIIKLTPELLLQPYEVLWLR